MSNKTNSIINMSTTLTVYLYNIIIKRSLVLSISSINKLLQLFTYTLPPLFSIHCTANSLTFSNLSHCATALFAEVLATANATTSEQCY